MKRMEVRRVEVAAEQKKAYERAEVLSDGFSADG
jgi:hypothetical protein